MQLQQNMFVNNCLLKATVSPGTIPDSILCFLMTKHNTEIGKCARLMRYRKFSGFQDNLWTEPTFHSHIWFVIYSHVLCKAIFPDTTLKGQKPSVGLSTTDNICTTAFQFYLNYKLINHLPWPSSLKTNSLFSVSFSFLPLLLFLPPFPGN